MSGSTHLQFQDRALAGVAEKVCAGERLGELDGLALMTSRDIHALGVLADTVRRRLHGSAAYYNVNRHINYTNLCALRCRFCSFYRTPGSPGGYELSIDEMADIAASAGRAGATEVHITGGLHPAWRIDHYERMLAGIRQAAPSLHIKAFTAVEIAHFARLSQISPEEVLRRLMAAGLNSMPGGGAEIFDDRVHDEAFAHKIGQRDWFDIHRTAHRLGLKTNATMLYGHVETPLERVRHLLKLRELQDETAGLQCIVPLSFVPAGSALSHLPGPTGLDDLRTLAVARLMLDNIPHIKSFWVMQGIKLSQIALDWGADDIDGTVVWYDITKAGSTAGPATHQEMSVDRIRRIILESGHTPIERDSLYRRVSG